MATQPTPVAANQFPDKAAGCVPSALLTIGRVVVHIFILMVVFMALCGAFMNVTKYFEQEDMKLPALTVLVYGWAFRMSHHFHVLIPGLLLIDIVFLTLLELLPRPFHWLARAWFAAVLVAAAVVLLAVNYAIALPFMAKMNVETDAPGNRAGTPKQTSDADQPAVPLESKSPKSSN